jgi:hypothetical protein
MSDTIPVQHESAVAVLREMEGELATKIQSLTDELRLANAQQDTLLNAISKLTRKPRVRKVVPPAEASTIFALPANDAAGETEAA